MSQSTPALEFLSALFSYPLAYQSALMQYAFGADSEMAVMIIKRSFILLPVLALIFAFWAAIPSMASVLVRSRRLEYMNNYLLACWDLGHAIFAYMAGIIKTVILVVGQVFNVLRMALAGLWMLLIDMVMAPFRTVRDMGRRVAAPGLPWIAACMTVLWCLLEAVIFTYVMSPLVMDTISNLSGQELRETSVRIPLFLFMLTVILGSYAVLAAWATAIASRDVAAIIRITAIEAVAVLLEILFLYREFVDALVPWFAMHSAGNFEPGAVLIIAVSFMVWLGVRGMTWFLFASHGTPILLAVIQGKGLGEPSPAGAPAQAHYLEYSGAYYQRIRQDADWMSERGMELLSALVLPPMQLVAACMNFMTLLIKGRAQFNLPFKNMHELMEGAKTLRPSQRKPNSDPPQPQMHAAAGTGGVQP